ncbi:MAG: hypothetical protein HHJ11_11620 [Phycicoccus sp.]|nr:hypothetical protein [Phycicoccus sp.]
MSMIEQLRATSDDGSTAIDPTVVDPRRRFGGGEALVALVAFVALCVAVLTRATQLLEPDDYAYRASIIALTRGHLSLTNTEYQALYKELSSGGGPGLLT